MTKIIESFEVTKNSAAGDLLTRKNPAGRLKIGFLACGYFEYWRMYPETLKKSVESDVTTVLKRIKSNVEFEIVYPGLVDTLDTAERAGLFFKEKQVDMILVMEGTYIPDFISLQAINHVEHLPVLFFSSQCHDNVDLKSDYESTLRNSALIGFTQLGGAFTKMGRKFEAVVGSINAPETYEKITSYARAVHVTKQLKNQNIGVIGHVFRGMYDLELDKTKIKGSLGPNVIYIQLSHLLDIWGKISEKETKYLAEKIEKRFAVEDISKDDIMRSCRLAIAMEKLIGRFNIDSLCFLDQHYLQLQTRSTARLGSSLLLEEGKHMVSCEGDIAGLIMMYIMKSLNGISPFFGEWGEFDVKNNAILIMMHGFADPKMARKPSDITVTPTPENWGFDGNGMNYQFTAKPGPVTLGHFINDANGWRMLIARGEAMSLDTIPCREITAMVKMDKPVKELLEKIIKKGVAHHVVMTYGDLTKELNYIADIMNIENFNV